MRRVKILIADDHPLFRRGLRETVEELDDARFGERVVLESADGEAALEDIHLFHPEIAIIDLAMPGMDGLKVLEKASAENLPVRIIIMTMYPDESYMRRAFEIGASAYLLKDDSENTIADCLEAVIAGDIFVSPSLREMVARPIPPKIDAKEKGQLKLLTKAQMQILREVAQYKTSKEIAEKLGVSYRTVQNHRQKIAHNLGLTGPHSLLEFALRNREAL